MPTSAEVEEALRLDDLFPEEVDRLKDAVSVGSVIFCALACVAPMCRTTGPGCF